MGSFILGTVVISPSNHKEESVCYPPDVRNITFEENKFAEKNPTSP